MANHEQHDRQKVRIRLCGTKPLVFDCQDVKRLRCDHRIVGALMGSLPRYPQQNGFYGLPLLLMAEETALVLQNEWGQLDTMEWHYPRDQRDVLKYHVYRSLWRRGYFITSGEKFGGDYLAYPGDPMRYHSHYIVSVRAADSSFTAMDLVTMGRLATNTKKTFVLATHRQEDSSSCNSSTSGSSLGTDTGSVDCFSITWAGF